MRIIRYSLICLSLTALPAYAQEPAPGENARLTIGVPAYVTHPDSRPGTRGWNEGWFQNEGVLVDATWPVYDITRDTKIRLGGTLGGFDNSIFRTSIFAGAVAEVETHTSDQLSFALGTYAGGITGYDGVQPALAPYVGTSYAFTPRFEMGARAFWLPAETIAGSTIAPSDAYVGVITVSTRF